jgi:dTDP-4-dehydrorhamnose reductase
VRVLLTGAGGQLGRALAPALVGHELTALEHAQLDIRQLEDVRAALAAHRPELVINAAAYNAVDAAEIDPDAAAAVNELGPWNLAAATAETGASLLHVSTDYVFDGSASVPYDEDAVPRPLSAYGKSKLAGEAAVRATNPRHFIVRTAWLYAAQGKNFPLTMLGLARKGAVRVVNDQTGSPTYAPHLAAAIARLLEEDAAFGTYHLAASGAASWYELTVALFERMRISAAVTPVTTAEFPRPAPRPRYSVLTTVREPRIVLPPWQEGLDAFVAAVAESAT